MCGMAHLSRNHQSCHWDADPDPRICGKGYWLLCVSGVTVELFPPDLMLRIEQINKTFVETKLQLATPDEVLVASDRPHILAEEELIEKYQKLHQFEEQCYAAGVMRPNICITTLPSGSREAVRSRIEHRGSQGLDRVNRDILLIKAKDQKGEPYLLHYYSGKARTGWDTWLVPRPVEVHTWSRGCETTQLSLRHSCEYQLGLHR